MKTGDNGISFSIITKVEARNHKGLHQNEDHSKTKEIQQMLPDLAID